MIMLLIIGLALGVLWTFYKQWISIYKYWEKKGVPFYPAEFPYGSDPNLVKLKEYRCYSIDKMYKKCAPHPLFGIIYVRTPILIVRDPELIQTILTKEFSHFRDRGFILYSDTDYMNHHLFNLKGDKWKALRMKLTPTFSTGKLKAMFPLFVTCAQELSTLLMTKLDSEVDMKELTGRYTSDVICSCAFGLETDVINHPDNRLREIATGVMNLTLFVKLKLALIRMFPQFSPFLSVRACSVEEESYIINLVKHTIEEREKNGIKRNDFLDLLIELREKGSIEEDTKDFTEAPFEMTLELMAAQCFIFFIAGFETSSSVQSFCLYELALHQDIQSRLIEEIERILKKFGEISYEAVKEMDYLDMVVSETMRKYPTLPNLVRCCNKTFTTSAGYRIEPETLVAIPVWSLHHDPQYYPDPENFDPERFSLENRDSIKPYTYLPFGEGPRMCIGKRFGLLQTKIGIISFLTKFQVVPCKETKVPMEFSAISLATNPKYPIILKLVARVPA